MTTRTTTRSRMNRQLSALGNYHPSIPLDDIFSCVSSNGGMVVQEDDTPWSGFLCGEKGNANMRILFPDNSKPMYLYIAWEKMETRTGYRYEMITYVS